MYYKYMIYPIEHALSTDAPDLHLPFPYASWGSKNGRIDQKSWKKRWGYHTADRTLMGHTIDSIILYQLKGGTRNTMYLTASDLMLKETGAGNTWSYKTEMTVYDEDVTSISAKTVTLTSGNPSTDGVDDGDYFILVDDYTAATESHCVLAYDAGDDGTGNIPDATDTVTGGTSGATAVIKLLPSYSGSFAAGTAAGDLILTKVTGTFIDDEALAFKDGETAVANGAPTDTWASIASVTTSTIVLDENYPGSTGTFDGGDKTGYVRRVYTMPTNARWSWCVVNDVLVFTNGNNDVQYWDGADYGTDLETARTVALKAYYCIEYADRLIIADYDTGARDPVKIAWSKNGDPTNWTDATSGSATLLGSGNYIMGLGKVGNDLIVYRLDSIMIGNRTGEARTPIIFPREIKGIGCAAPWSIVEANGTNYFVGRNDFFMYTPGRAVPIGGKIRDKFFAITEWTEVEKTWGQHYELRNEIEWVANTTEGRLAFVYNYKYGEWSVNEYIGDIVAAGKGAIEA